MEIHMAFRQMDATDALKNHVNDKTEKLKKFLSNVTHLNWIFYVSGDEHVADLRVQGPHVDFFAQSKTPDMYQSIDDVVSKIEKQLRKHKEILKDHIHRNRGDVTGAMDVDTDESSED